MLCQIIKEVLAVAGGCANSKNSGVHIPCTYSFQKDPWLIKRISLLMPFKVSFRVVGFPALCLKWWQTDHFLFNLLTSSRLQEPLYVKNYFHSHLQLQMFDVIRHQCQSPFMFKYPHKGSLRCTAWPFPLLYLTLQRAWGAQPCPSLARQNGEPRPWQRGTHSQDIAFLREFLNLKAT